MRHQLKTWPQAFNAVYCGLKPYEVRKDDRGFQVGDELLLNEWEPSDSHYTGRKILVSVTHISKDVFGLPPDLVVMGIKLQRWAFTGDIDGCTC